jgi:hypothetical protein
MGGLRRIEASPRERSYIIPTPGREACAVDLQKGSYPPRRHPCYSGVSGARQGPLGPPNVVADPEGPVVCAGRSCVFPVAPAVYAGGWTPSASVAPGRLI